MSENNFVEQYSEVDWFGDVELENILSVVIKKGSNRNEVDEIIRSILINKNDFKKVFPILLKIIDDYYSVVLDWLEIDGGKFIIYLTTEETEDDVIGTDVVEEKDGVKSAVKEKIILLVLKINSFMDEDVESEEGRHKSFLFNFMYRSMYLMLYSDLVINRKKVADKFITMDIVREVILKTTEDTIRDFNKWLVN